MLKLLLSPAQRNYSIRERESIIQSKLEGGPNRYRRDLLDQDLIVECEFVCTAEQYQYLRSFYNINGRGAYPFLIDLLLETFELRTYTARFQAGSFKLNDVRGTHFVVRANLDVERDLSGLDIPATVAAFALTGPDNDGNVIQSGTNLPKLLIRPDQAQYIVTRGDDIVQTSIKGAPAERMRPNYLHDEMIVECQFSLTPVEYNYLRAFYNFTNQGSDPFLLDLLGDDARLQTFVGHFRSGTFKLQQLEGNLIRLRTTFHVVPKDGNIDYAALANTWIAEPYVAPVYPGDFGSEPV